MHSSLSFAGDEGVAEGRYFLLSRAELLGRRGREGGVVGGALGRQRNGEGGGDDVGMARLPCECRRDRDGTWPNSSRVDEADPDSGRRGWLKDIDRTAAGHQLGGRREGSTGGGRAGALEDTASSRDSAMGYRGRHGE